LRIYLGTRDKTASDENVVVVLNDLNQRGNAVEVETNFESRVGVSNYGGTREIYVREDVEEYLGTGHTEGRMDC
jgi:hypothetical protein